MALNAKNLSVLAYANGFTLWHYATTENIAAVKGAGYFDPVSGIMKAGDVIITGAADAGMLIKVASNTEGAVGVDELD